MFTDPTCTDCNHMLHSEYGIEEPHIAHCEFGGEHEPGGHAQLEEDRKTAYYEHINQLYFDYHN